MQQIHSTQAAHMRQGVMVALGLALLTIVEFAVATGHLAASLFLIAMLAFAKIALIATNFMHVGKLFHGEGEDA